MTVICQEIFGGRKDRSIAYFTRVDFSNNETDIAAYMKKSIFGGSNVVLDGDLHHLI